MSTPRRLGILLLVLVVGLSSSMRAQDSAAALGLDSLLNTKVSTASKYGQTVIEAASSVTIITADDIERFGYRTLDEALATVSGFYLSSDREDVYLGTRGFGPPVDYNNRMLLLLDGATMNESMWGSAPIGHEMGMPLQSLERIEIVRGPGSALYGAGAMFAVVNLVTKSAAVLDGADLYMRGGSYGHRGVTALFGRRFMHGLSVTIAGEWDYADGADLYYPEYDAPETNHGIAHHLDWERRWSMFGRVTAGPWTFHGRYNTRTKASPTADYGSDFDIPGSQGAAGHGFLQLAYDKQVSGAHRVAVRTFFSSNWLDGQVPYGGEFFNYNATGEQLGGEGTIQWDIASSHRLTIGAEIRKILRADFVYPAGLIDVHGQSTVVSAYLQDELQVSRRVTLMGGARVDQYTTTSTAFTPRAALIYALSTTTTLKALYGQAHRAPTLSEFTTGVAAGTESEIDPETARTFEALWQQRLGRYVLGTASVYQYEAAHLIEPVTDSTGQLARYRNLGRATAVGMEVGVEVRASRRFNGYINYSYQNARDDETKERLVNSPVHLLKGGFGLEPRTWLRPALELRYESPRRTVYGGMTEPYLLTNFHAVILPGIRMVELSLFLNNVFDIMYASPGGLQHRQAVIAQDGRNISAELRYRF